MQLPLTADLLVPLGAGVVILAALLVLWAWLRCRKAETGAQLAHAQQAIAEQPPEQPTADAERVDGAPAQQQRAATPPAPSFAAVPAHWFGGSRPSAAPAPHPAAQHDAADQEPAELPRMAPAPAGPPSGPVPVAPWTRAEEQVAEPRHDRAVPVASDNAGSSGSVAAAVAQAFTARAAAARAAAQGVPAQPPHGQQPIAEPRRPQQVRHTEPRSEEPLPVPHGDARDRLLAVLLHDPAGAVHATRELDVCLAQLEHLSHAMRHEREVLRGVLQRLADSGLRTDQLARLAGMPVEELQALTAPAS